MIKAVFFDIDDTLFPFSEKNLHGMDAVEKYLYETCRVTKGELHQAIDSAQNRMGSNVGFTSAAFHNRQIRFQNALEILGVPIYPYASRMYDIYWNTVLDEAEPEPGLLELLKKLKEKKIFLGIGSDMTSYIQNKKLEKMNIAPYFDAVITSEEAGMDKPCGKIFELCAKKAGCKTKECLFIGDNEEKDYRGAQKAGMQALCYGKYSGGIKGETADNFDSYEKIMPQILQLCSMESSI